MADSRISLRVRTVFEDPLTEAYVSSVSGFEIANKVRLGKLDLGPHAPTDLPALLTGLGYHSLPLSLIHAHSAGRYLAMHRDPFDRMLAAQSQLERMPLVTADPAFAVFPVETLW